MTEHELGMLLEEALALGADFAEFFLEDRFERNIRYRQGSADGAVTIRQTGTGIHLMCGTDRIYAFESGQDPDGARDLLHRAASLLRGTGAVAAVPALVLRERRNPNAPEILPSAVGQPEKEEVLKAAAAGVADSGLAVHGFTADWFETDQTIRVANSEGLYTGERRVTTRVRLGMTVEDRGTRQYNWEDYTRAQGFEAFSDPGVLREFAKDMALRTALFMNAKTVSPRTVPVVLSAGACGTLWHESCGHSLEGPAIAAKRSAFCGMLGRKVASDRVTLIDDGTIPGLYGTSAVDDEGTARQSNVLIERGVLRSFLLDRYHARLLGLAMTGSGRRQNYTYAPTARMSNTFLAPGEDEEDGIISSTGDGLLVTRIGGGNGGMQFTLEVKEGYLIRDGKVTEPVRGLMLTGNGMDVIGKIDRVGRELVHEQGGGFCGAASGLVPVTSSQPMVRISEMTLGGEG